MSALQRRSVAPVGAGVAGLVLLHFLSPPLAPFGVIVLGAILGTVTGLLAVGLVLVYRTTRVVNFAYGAMGGLPASIGIELYLAKGVPWPVAALIAVAAGILTGMAVERIVIRR